MARFRLPLISLALLAAAGAQAEFYKTYDLLDVNWSVRLDEPAEKVIGSVVNTVKMMQAASRVSFHASKIKVDAVTVNGAKATFFLVPAEQLVTVNLPQQASAGQTLKIKLDYTTKPEAGVYFVTADRAHPARTPMIYTQGQAYDTRYWLPTYDHPNDKATSESRITVPSSYNVLGNGRLLEKPTAKGMTTYHWKMDQAHSTYLISFVAGPYTEKREEWSGIPVSYYSPAGLEAMGDSSFAGTWQMVRFFSELTGFKYPYAKFSQAVVADFPFGGMENISAVTNTLGTLHPRSEKPFASSDGLNLHELAHQWFGDWVTCRDWAHAWLNEGFASFLPTFYSRREGTPEGLEEYDINRRGTLMGAVGAMQGKPRQMIGESAIPMDNFDGHTYGGGAARMFMLMDQLTEPVFWKGVQTWLTEFGQKNGTTEQFFEVMARVSGKNLDKFRQQWFYTAAMPKVTAQSDGVTLTLSQSAPYFDLPLDVWVLDGTTWGKLKVNLAGASTRLDLGRFANKPYLVDPECRFAMTLQQDVPGIEGLTGMFEISTNAATRQRLLEMMGGNAAKAAERLLEREWAPATKRMLVEALPADQTDRWYRMTSDTDAHLRMTAVNKLGYGPYADKAIARLQAIWSGSEASEALKLAALNGYMRHTKDATAMQKAWGMNSYDEKWRRTALRWFVANQPDKAREMALSCLSTPHSYPMRIEAVRVLGDLKDKPGSTAAYDAIVRFMNNTGFGGIQAGIGALRSYGNKEAIPILKRYENWSMFYVSENAKGAVRQLSGR